MLLPLQSAISSKQVVAPQAPCTMLGGSRSGTRRADVSQVGNNRTGVHQLTGHQNTASRTRVYPEHQFLVHVALHGSAGSASQRRRQTTRPKQLHDVRRSASSGKANRFLSRNGEVVQVASEFRSSSQA